MVWFFFFIRIQGEAIKSWNKRNRNCLLCDWVSTRIYMHGNRLDALAVDNAGAVLVILLLRDPHFLGGRERRQNRSADPHGVLALRRRDDSVQQRASLF